MTQPFDTVAVLGLGLLGGSVAHATRIRGLARRVVGIGRRRETADLALARGIVDEVRLDPAEGARGADLLVLATPVASMARVLEQAAPSLRAGALVTDVGSVKQPLVESLPALLPEGVTYVGAHPMAGSHESGLEHARADLLEAATCVITPTEGAEQARACDRIASFFEALGARVVRRHPSVHDAEVAWVSHVPHAAAFAFSHALEGAPAAAGELRGGGFRDFTRIARSDPDLWADILVQNQKALAGPLRDTAEALATLARLVEAGDGEAVHRFLAAARDTLARHAGPPDPGATHPEIKAAPEAATKE